MSDSPAIPLSPVPPEGPRADIYVTRVHMSDPGDGPPEITLTLSVPQQKAWGIYMDFVKAVERNKVRR